MKAVESRSERTLAPPARTVELDHGQSVTVARASVKVVYGWVWLVGAGRADDFLLGSDEAPVRLPRKSVVRAIGRTRIQVTDLVHVSLLRRLAQTLRRWVRASARPRAIARGAAHGLVTTLQDAGAGSAETTLLRYPGSRQQCPRHYAAQANATASQAATRPARMCAWRAQSCSR